MGKLGRWLWRRLMLLHHSTSHPRKRELHINGDPSWPRKGCPNDHHFPFYYDRGPDFKVSCKKCWPSMLINQRPDFLIAHPQAADEYDNITRVDNHTGSSCINDDDGSEHAINDDDGSDHAINDGQPGINTAGAAQYCCSSSSGGLNFCLKPSKTMLTQHKYPVYLDPRDRRDKAHLCRSFSQGDGHHRWQRQYNKLGTVHHRHDHQRLLRRCHSCRKSSTINGSCNCNHHRSSHGRYKQHRDHSTVMMKGYVAIYVGEDEGSLERFLVPISYLSHPAFRELLQRAEKEFGFAQKAGLTIPCGLAEFYQTVRKFHHHDHHDVQEHSTQPHCIPFDNVIMCRSFSYNRL